MALGDILIDVSGVAKHYGEGGKAPPVEIADEFPVGFIKVDEKPGRGGDQDAGNDVDQEQPVP